MQKDCCYFFYSLTDIVTGQSVILCSRICECISPFAHSVLLSDFFSLLALQGSNGFPGFPGANGEKGTRVRKKKMKYMHTESLSFPSDQGASYILKGDTYD